MVQMTNFVASTVPIKRFFGGKTKTATPTGTNRPGYSSKPSSPTGTNRPGFSAPRPSFLSGLGSDKSEVPKKLEATRQRFFKGDPTISDERLKNRYTQFAEYEKFKNDPTKTKLVEGTTNLYQAATPGGKTLADKAMELAFKYGPTPSEVLSDMGKGIGSMAQGFAEKGSPVMGLLTGLFDKVKSMVPKEGTPSFFNPGDITGLVNALPDAQKRIYYDLLSSGVPYQQAYEQASGLPFTKFMNMAMGGVASLQ